MIRINLLPVRQARKKQALVQSAIVAGVGLVVVLLVCFSLWTTINASINRLETQNGELKTEIENLSRVIGEVDAYKDKIKEAKKKKEVIERLRANRAGPVRVLDELAGNTPKKVWLTEVMRRSDKVTIKGLSLSEQDIASFMRSLQESEYFDGVKLEQITRDKDAGDDDFKVQGFQLTCRVTMPDPNKKEDDEGDKGADGGDGPTDGGTP
jgi:type IV pilus assembly protein PilN